MFDFVRSHSRWLQLGLLALILPSFVVFGVQGYSSMTDGANASVAEVDGHKITQAEWDARVQQQAERLRAQMPDLDPKLLDGPQAREEALKALVDARVLQTATDTLRLTALGDERLQRLFTQDPQMAAFRNADGSLNKDLLAAQGMSSAALAGQLRRDYLLRQVQGGIAGTALVPAAVADRGLDAVLQRRAVQFTRLAVQDQAGRVNPTDAELTAYFDAHRNDFRTPEQAEVQYVVLQLDALKQGLSVSEDELRKYYDENAARYTAAEERRARHILITADKDAAADVKAKAKARAEELLAEARKNPAGFADLAKKHSQDPGSAANGGDLDFFGRGAMVKPFEDAAFALKPGEISPVIQSDFGFHIIQLEAVRGGQKQAFEAVRAQIEDEVRKQLATRRWAEAAEQFSNTVYEQSDSLQPVADKLKLTVQTATVGRQAAAGAQGALASAKLLAAIYGDEALKNKRNTDAIEIGPNQLAAARVVRHQPAAQRPLEQVRDVVRQAVALQQAKDVTAKAAAALLAQVKAQPTLALASGATIARNQPGDLPREAVLAILAADARQLPAATAVALADGSWLVARITEVLPRAVPAEQAQALQAQVRAAWGRAEADAYLEALKTRFHVSLSDKAKAVAQAAAASAAAAR
ncbi:MAG: hypothetical protein RLY78_1843 [Pseudomonadota bacterium]|jgi:peptidyl-prolyl cis-trans isomerase D|uniref:Periplasmic chaperone PpiD n=1 Tax=Pseudaquabacterium rugosum TaxID=2984194 RepID=A0ABU9B6G4_9BURK